jgi:cytochrome c553
MKSSMKWSIVIVIVLVGVVLACGFGMIRRGFSTRDKPSAVEAFLAETVRSWAIPAKAKLMTNPVHPSAEVYADARAHFADHCAQCHANNGRGDTPMGRRTLESQLAPGPTWRSSRPESYLCAAIHATS